jgi:amidase
MDTLLLQSATDVALLLRRKEVSSRELTESLLTRIEEINPALNAVVEVQHDRALQQAAAADRAVARGEDVGPLNGVPITIKDSFHVAGWHTTWGEPGFKDYVADWDATVVRRLKAAGALIVGKTNAAFMLADFGQTANPLYGVTNNPWDLSRSPGGSSGGSAAAVAAGLSFLDYGSDIVGSLRIPAAFCGTYCLRPTAGTVPLTGFQPPGPPAPPSEMTYVSAVGPLARSAADLRTALRITAGPEGPAAKAYDWHLPLPRRTRLSDFRVGVVLNHERAPVSTEMTGVLANLVDRLAETGATLVEGWPDGIDPVTQAETFGFHVGVFLAHQQPAVELPDPSQLVAQERARMAARSAWSTYFSEMDVFLSPVNFTPAIPHDSRVFEERSIMTPEGERRYDEQPFWIAPASLSGLPTVVAPVGTTPAGLPVSVQLAAPRYEDDTAITFAALLAELTGGYQPPSPSCRPSAHLPSAVNGRNPHATRSRQWHGRDGRLSRTLWRIPEYSGADTSPEPAVDPHGNPGVPVAGVSRSRDSAAAGKMTTDSRPR